MFALLSLACVDSRLARVLNLLNHQHKVELFFRGLGASFGCLEFRNEVEGIDPPRGGRHPHIGHHRTDHASLNIAAPVAERFDGLIQLPLRNFGNG